MYELRRARGENLQELGAGAAMSASTAAGRGGTRRLGTTIHGRHTRSSRNYRGGWHTVPLRQNASARFARLLRTLQHDDRKPGRRRAASIIAVPRVVPPTSFVPREGGILDHRIGPAI